MMSGELATLFSGRYVELKIRVYESFSVNKDLKGLL